MKTLMFAACIILSASAFAQTDTTSFVVKQGDPAVQATPDDIQQMNLKDMTKVMINDMPEDVKSAIGNARYKGTQTYYKHKNKDEYAVEVKEGEVTSYHFYDKNGKPLNQRN